MEANCRGEDGDGVKVSPIRAWPIVVDAGGPSGVATAGPSGLLPRHVGVVNHLDLSPIISLYEEERGCPPYHPCMMV